MASLSGFSQDTTDGNSIVTTLYFIRHAEKDLSNPNEKNMHLTPKGKERAVKWSDVLKDIKFDAVYSTDYHRTKETAQPTAEKCQLEITIYKPNSIDMEAFKKEIHGKTVLIVGHSNTIPGFVNRIIGQKKHRDIDESRHGNLYIVTIIDGKTADQVLTIN